jgi:hypothetical protein
MAPSRGRPASPPAAAIAESAGVQSFRMNRRRFLQSATAAPLAAAPSSTVHEPYFPSAAHQLVWRNWDLVPASRIAAALDCPPETVAALARSLSLGPQRLSPRYRSRLRFKALARNWDFVPAAQLRILLDMTADEVRRLLSHDAFYLAHLGPQPDLPVIRADAVSAAPLPLFQFPPTGPAEDRFAFVADLERPSARAPWASSAPGAFQPRIAFPYLAVFGDVLAEPDFETYYPDGLLANMAALGLTAIWLHAVLRDLVSTADFPEFGPDRLTRLARLNWLIARARRHGLGVYLYLNEPRAMSAAFFDQHPDLKGAPGHAGDGLFSMCTSTAPVKRYLYEASAALFRQAPGLTGAFLITASENPTNCYSLARRTACPRCRERSGAEVIGEVVRLIEQGAHSAAPDAHIIAWDWSWGVVEDDPQASIIAALPPTVTLMVDFERGTPITRGGVASLVDEYSLSVVGPSPRAAAHIRHARSRGMRVMAKAQVGNTWELSLLPYIPVGRLVARKFESMHAAGISGVMESWTLGTCPSPNWSVAQAYYGAHPPAPDVALEKVAADLYGPANSKRVLAVWKRFAEIFERYPFSNTLVYSSVIQAGPAQMWWLTPSGKRARILHSYDNLGWCKPFGPEVAAGIFAGMAADWQRASSDLPPSPARDYAVCRAVGLYFESIANFLRFHARCSSAPPAELRALLASEIRLATEFLDLCRADSRFGFEASLQYFYLPLDIQEKIAACRWMLEKLPRT